MDQYTNMVTSTAGTCVTYNPIPLAHPEAQITFPCPTVWPYISNQTTAQLVLTDPLTEERVRLIVAEEIRNALAPIRAALGLSEE